MAECIARVVAGLWSLPESLSLLIIPGCPCHRLAGDLSDEPREPRHRPTLEAELTRGVGPDWERALDAALLWVQERAAREPMLEGLLKSYKQPLPMAHRITVYPYRGGIWGSKSPMVIKVIRHNVREVG